MTLARLSLVLTALVFASFGIWLFIAPESLAMLGVELTSPVARAEVRSFYGGLELGLAMFFGLAAARPGWFRAGLAAQAASLGGAATGRALGMMIDGTASLHLVLFAAEASGAALGLLALVRLPRHETITTAAPGI